MATLDIVIPTLDIDLAHSTVKALQDNATYCHHYVIVDNSHEPRGYTEPCNGGAKVGNAPIVCFVNDDIFVTKEGWDEPLVEEARKGTYCFGPLTNHEQNMRINGWFLCLRRDYMDVYGYAFDPIFKVWCGDIDLLKRLEKNGIEPVLIPDTGLIHEYSRTSTRPDLQEWIVPQQVMDCVTYKARWGTDPNEDKVRSGNRGGENPRIS